MAANKTKIEIIHGKVFIDDVHVTDPAYIGCCFMDFAETLEEDGYKMTFKDQDVFVEGIITEV